MHIHFWGTRGSIAVAGKDTVKYGGNSTCLELRLDDGNLIVVDAGTGIRGLGQRLIESGKPVKVHLLMTHIHWDHILGFPFFDPIYLPTTRIVIDGTPRAQVGLETIFESGLRDGFFPVRFSELKADIQFRKQVEHNLIKVGDTAVESMGIQHPNGGLGFKFMENDKTMVFLTDNELNPEGWKGRKPEDFARFCRDVDLLIHDSQYTPEEITDKQWWGHSDYVSVLKMAREAGVKRLLLTHHDPTHTDRFMDDMMAACRDKAREIGFEGEVAAAREETVTL